MVRARSFAGSVLVVTALAGCSTGATGTPYPVDASIGPASRSAKAAALPARPQELPVKGVDPCSLLTADQQKQLQISAPPHALTTPQDGPTCVFDAEPAHAFHVRTVTADLTEWVTGKRRKNSMTTEPHPVGAFPALTNYRAAGTPSDCETLIGVAPGQTLAVQAFAVATGVDTQPGLCELSGHAAELALQTLKAHT